MWDGGRAGSRAACAASTGRQPEPESARKFAERARRHDAMVHQLLADGHGIRTIARHLGWGRHTVQRNARAATWQELVDGHWQAPRVSKLDHFKPCLHRACPPLITCEGPGTPP
jgi:hypothetical protein